MSPSADSRPPTDPPRGERALVRAIGQMISPATGEPPPRVPFGDDMAAVPGESRLLWTTDTLMDGVDFESGRHAWNAIGRKALAVSLSDCAAMAAQPIAALASVVLDERLSHADALELHRGIFELGQSYRCPLVGGDTNSWQHPTVISTTVLARVEIGANPVPRGGARGGDTLWISGPLGGSLLGRHLWFEPRIALARTIRDTLAPRAMMDISDGLVLDLSRMLENSGCGARLDRTALSNAIHADAQTMALEDARPALDHALYDGEDFELLIALTPLSNPDTARALGLIQIGEIVAGAADITLREADGRERALEIRGWEHFRA